MCKKEDCPIFDTCDKEQEQALYCRKIELLIHLTRVGKMSKTRPLYTLRPVLPTMM